MEIEKCEKINKTIFLTQMSQEDIEKIKSLNKPLKFSFNEEKKKKKNKRKNNRSNCT